MVSDVADANAEFSFASLPFHRAEAPATPAFVSGCNSSSIALQRRKVE
jgi:hypothetical protein